MGPLVIDLTETPPRSPLALGRNITVANGGGIDHQSQPQLLAHPPGLAPSTPQAPQRPQHDPPPHDDGPPAKKRRVALSWAEKQNIACQQVSPYVSQALKYLPASQFTIDEIAIKAVSLFAKDPLFVTRLDQANGYTLPPNDEWTTTRARMIITELAKRPEFRINTPARPPPITSESVPIKSEGLPVQSDIVARVQTPASPKPSPPRRRWIQLRQPAIPTARRREAAPNTKNGSRWKPAASTGPSQNAWFGLEQRPYQSAADRVLIAKGADRLYRELREQITSPLVYHVDFTSEEVQQIMACLSRYLPPGSPATPEYLAQICQHLNVPSIVENALPRRTPEDVRNYCSDLLARKAVPPSQARVLSLDPKASKALPQQEKRRASRLASLLLAREMEGNRGFGRMRQYENFQNEFSKLHEDSLTLVAEYTNCAGDIATTTWVPNNNVLCGTTVHSDSHNQQYNKPGNLLLLSTKLGQLKAFPDHRIPRPLVEKGENSTTAMRQSQDPWLYSSVVCSDYDPILGLAYTSSFDRTVKVWKIDEAGSTMTALATWYFGGNVNFVSAAKDGSGRVATAADVPTEAIRIYTVNMSDLANSPYISFSCTRTDANGSGKWAYYPATMQWGRGPSCTHLLAVGYSPRSFSGDDHDIPEEKHDTGEMTLWDAVHNQRIPITTAATANYFEVAWHPVLPRFIAATSPSHIKAMPGVRSQIHLFRAQVDGFAEYHNLDCFASDINELTFMPNSATHAYVTAGCTDGKVYVWDTAQGDKPVLILQHGRPLDEYYEDREKEDTGVKFTAWGNSLDRFYTGASDGTVMVWNIRQKSNPYVRTLLEAPGPISCGAFSPDLRKMVVGDATGRVFLFSVDREDEPEAHFIKIPGVDRRLRRPTPFIPHPEPEPPYHDPAELNSMVVDHDDDMHIADLVRRMYLDTQQIVIHPNPTIGAVQGPNYASTGLFRHEAHLAEDPANPLLIPFERARDQRLAASRGQDAIRLRRLRDPGRQPSDARLHAANKAREFDEEELPPQDLADFAQSRVEFVLSEVDCGFVYEEVPGEEGG
ncbi:WD40 repeat-like protein [Trichoderma citrinoviride]|uniref:WD40 repeat-like protein n=1 Tax=Trichoderma citrinoviride TaxID=58853 RepID=A0A2T4B3B4_9HYPO|nr:WD40 repeat-like protein [Trichoderma citrinoviride]PTB63822.1 WD40 repeat-like protein [Trichoderma citrinoviride]